MGIAFCSTSGLNFRTAQHDVCRTSCERFVANLLAGIHTAKAELPAKTALIVVPDNKCPSRFINRAVWTEYLFAFESLIRSLSFADGKASLHHISDTENARHG